MIFRAGATGGMMACCPMRPMQPTARLTTLKALVDAAHDLGLMIFLDVVYNHFGPDGNYLSLYAPQFFREDHHTPWGAAIDFRQPEVRGLLHRQRAVLADGLPLRRAALRCGACHRWIRTGWTRWPPRVRAAVEPGPPCASGAGAPQRCVAPGEGLRRAVE